MNSTLILKFHTQTSFVQLTNVNTIIQLSDNSSLVQVQTQLPYLIGWGRHWGRWWGRSM